MIELKLILYQAAAGTALLTIGAGVTAIPAVRDGLADWDTPLVAAIATSVLIALVAASFVLLVDRWAIYSALATVWVFVAMILASLLTSVFHAAAVEKAGPAGMAFIFPVIAFSFALPVALALRVLWRAFSSSGAPLRLRIIRQ